MSKVALIADIRIADAHIAEAKALLADLVAVVVQEPGNEVYVATQSKEDPGLFRVLEVYSSAAAVEEHKANKKAREVLAKLIPLMSAPLSFVALDVVA